MSGVKDFVISTPLQPAAVFGEAESSSKGAPPGVRVGVTPSRDATTARLGQISRVARGGGDVESAMEWAISATRDAVVAAMPRSGGDIGNAMG